MFPEFSKFSDVQFNLYSYTLTLLCLKSFSPRILKIPKIFGQKNWPTINKLEKLISLAWKLLIDKAKKHLFYVSDL